MEQDVDVMKEDIKNNIEKLNNYIEALSFEAEDALNKKQLELNEIAEEREKQEEQIRMEEQMRLEEEQKRKEIELEEERKSYDEDIPKGDVEDEE